MNNYSLQQNRNRKASAMVLVSAQENSSEEQRKIVCLIGTVPCVLPIFLEKSGSLNFKHFSALGEVKWSSHNPVIWSVTQANASPGSLRSTPFPVSLSQTDVFCGQKILAGERPCEQTLGGAHPRKPRSR